MGEHSLNGSEEGTFGGSQETEVTHFHETGRQDMLEEAVDEMLHGGGAGLELSGIGSAVLESDLGSLEAAIISEAHQTAIGDSDAEDVRGEVLEGSLSIADWFAVNDPVLAPNLWSYLSKDGGFFEDVLKFGPEELGECLDGEKEVVVSGHPNFPVLGKSAAGDQIVDMGMIGQVAGPGVQDAEHADLAAEVTGVTGQGLGRFCRSLEEGMVEEFLVSAGRLPQFFRKRESQQEVR